MINDILVYQLDKDRAKLALFVVLAAGNDLVQLVERHLVHDFLHKRL